MDDHWLQAISSSAPALEKPPLAPRPSLLQQPAEGHPDVVPDPLLVHENQAWNGPPKATVARRAQSYSDFYYAVNAYSRRESESVRRRSIDNEEHKKPAVSVEAEFDTYLGSLQAQMLDESHAKFQTYHEQLELTDTHLQQILTSTSRTLAIMASLSTSFKAVEAQTESFRLQCEALIKEQSRAEALADAIDENLAYFTFLEPMTRRLNAPGAANLVKGRDFPDMLSNLDNCLAYMESHPDLSEAATYRSRYRLLMTRSLTLIAQHFTKSLGDIASDISKRIQGGQLKETTHSALLYAKFRVPAPELKALTLEVQKRAVPTPEDVDAGREPEYLSLLRELYQSYSAARGRLILPLVTKKMVELSAGPQSSDALAFAEAGFSFMRGVCLDEFDLWYEWFETEGDLYDFLEALMDPLYDTLRPKTIHETKLERLCDLCAMIQGRYIAIDEDDEDEHMGRDTDMASLRSARPLGRRLDFANLVQPALEDAQTRLVFLAMNLSRDSIENYRAKPEDLNIAAKATAATTNGTTKGPVLSGKRDPPPPATPATPATPVPKTPVIVDDGDSVFGRAASNQAKPSSGRQWYPTLHTAIWLLRRIYRLVNSTVFDDLAHRIVHSTIASLLTAGQQVTSRKNAQEGQLFLIAHLLHLKQQIVAFDIEFIPPEVEFDFSSVTNTFYELRDRGSLWNPASWVRLVSGAVVGGGLLPKVIENMLDAKAELDGRLRTVINDFVHGWASHIVAPIEPSAVAQAQQRLDNLKPSSTPNPNHPPPPTPAFDPLKAVRTVRGLAEKHVPILRTALDSVLDDARTRETLVAAVRDQVVLAYDDFFDAYTAGQPKRLSRKGKAAETEVWGPDLFRDAMAKVFLVGRTINDDDDDDDDDRDDVARVDLDDDNDDDARSDTGAVQGEE